MISIPIMRCRVSPVFAKLFGPKYFEEIGFAARVNSKKAQIKNTTP